MAKEVLKLQNVNRPNLFPLTLWGRGGGGGVEQFQSDEKS